MVEETTTSRRGLKLKLDKLQDIPKSPDFNRPYLKFKPEAFIVEHPKLEERFIEASVQWSSFEAFKKNPVKAQTFVVSSSPDDASARYFAAYLVQLHLRHMKFLARDPHVAWETVMSGFDNPGLTKEQAPTIMVITNLCNTSGPVKFEKVRDLIERWAKVPKIIVVSGEDPISFAAMRLKKPVHALAYFPSKITKAANTVI